MLWITFYCNALDTTFLYYFRRLAFFCPRCSLTQTFLSLHCLWITDEMSGCCCWRWQQWRRRRWRWWGRKLSVHSLRVPPAPTTIICLTGSKSPPSQIFTGCWFHSVTVTIWSLHGGLISRTRPIRKLSASRARHVNRRQKCTRTHGQTRTRALDLCLCGVMFVRSRRSVHTPSSPAFSRERGLDDTGGGICEVAL